MLLATLAQAAVHGPEALTEGETVLGLNAEGWVYVSLTIFLIAMVWFGRAHHRLRDALDAKINETRRQLDEATAVRTEAQALLTAAKARDAASAGDAAAIVEQAEHEAAAMLDKAERDATDLIARRARMAEDKIAAAERGAVSDVRALAADAAAGAARSLIVEHHGAAADRAMVDRAISGLGRPN